jgi:hypothetical protein
VKWILASSMGRGRDKGDDERGARGAAGDRPTAPTRGGGRWPSHHRITAHTWVRTGQDTRHGPPWAAGKWALSI